MGCLSDTGHRALRLPAVGTAQPCQPGPTRESGSGLQAGATRGLCPGVHFQQGQGPPYSPALPCTPTRPLRAQSPLWLLHPFTGLPRVPPFLCPGHGDTRRSGGPTSPSLSISVANDDHSRAPHRSSLGYLCPFPALTWPWPLHSHCTVPPRAHHRPVPSSTTPMGTHSA